MAIVRFTGQPVMMPEIPEATTNVADINSTLLNAATTVKWGGVGSVWWAGAGDSKNLQQFEVYTGAVTAGTGTIQFSTQGVSTAVGGATPDGTPVKTSTTTTYPSANSVFNSGNLSSVQAVTRGQQLAVVVEFSLWTSGSINIRSMGSGIHKPYNAFPNSQAFAAAAWGGPTNYLPLVKLYFDDATIGTLAGGWYGIGSTETYNSGSSPLERGNLFQFGMPVEFEAIEVMAGINSGYTQNMSLLLYKGTALQETVTVDGHNSFNTGPLAKRVALSTRYTAAANEAWYVMVKATTAGNIDLGIITVVAAGDLALLPGGTEVQYATFAAGTPTVTSTKRAMVSLLASGFDGGGGAGAQYSGILQGMVV